MRAKKAVVIEEAQQKVALDVRQILSQQTQAAIQQGATPALAAGEPDQQGGLSGDTEEDKQEDTA